MDGRVTEIKSIRVGRVVGIVRTLAGLRLLAIGRYSAQQCHHSDQRVPGKPQGGLVIGSPISRKIQRHGSREYFNNRSPSDSKQLIRRGRGSACLLQTTAKASIALYSAKLQDQGLESGDSTRGAETTAIG